MNKILSLLSVSMICAITLAQSPDMMSYQAVIRNANGNLVSSTSVGIQVSILQHTSSGTAIYIERHSTNSNANGLVSIEIGNGTVVTGSFSGINWNDGPYFLKTETDPSGGTTYSIEGISQLLSVPYALHATSAENVNDDDADSTNEIQMLSRAGDTISLENGGSFVDSVGRYSAGKGIQIKDDSISVSVSDFLSDILPAGIVLPFAGDTSKIPNGWLLCNGFAISTSQYPELFSAIGTSWGTSGTGMFNLPDLRGRFVRGQDLGSGNDPNAGSRTGMSGGNTGDNVGTYQLDDNKQHNHGITDPGHSHSTLGLWNISDNDRGTFSSTWSIDANSWNSSTTVATGISVNNSGTESRPKNASLNYIIKY